MPKQQSKETVPVSCPCVLIKKDITDGATGKEHREDVPGDSARHGLRDQRSF